MQRLLTQLVPGGENGRPQAGIVVGVGEGCEVVLQPTVSEVEHYQATAHSQQQQEEDGHHHCCHVTRAALAMGGIVRAWRQKENLHVTSTFKVRPEQQGEVATFQNGLVIIKLNIEEFRSNAGVRQRLSIGLFQCLHQ